MNIRRVVTVVTVLVFLYFAKPSGALGQIAGVASRRPAPEFSLIDASGLRVQQSNYKGKVVLLAWESDIQQLLKERE